MCGSDHPRAAAVTHFVAEREPWGFLEGVSHEKCWWFVHTVVKLYWVIISSKLDYSNLKTVCNRNVIDSALHQRSTSSLQTAWFSHRRWAGFQQQSLDQILPFSLKCGPILCPSFALSPGCDVMWFAGEYLICEVRMRTRVSAHTISTLLIPETICCESKKQTAVNGYTFASVTRRSLFCS